MLFRIVGINGDNVRIIADKDIANVNYDGIDEWFKYYEDHLTSKAKKMIVKTKYCDMTINDATTDTTQCNHYSEANDIGLLSIDEMNRISNNKDDASYTVLDTISWLANSKDDKNAYVVSIVPSNTAAVQKQHNYGVRPVITIKGDALIKNGDGTEENPYVLTDYIKPKSNVQLNERYTGEYITYGGMLWRIIEVNSDGTTKVISEQNLMQDDEYVTFAESEDASEHIYNPNQSNNIGYFINNRSSEYMDTKYFVNHEIEVPIYKAEPMYQKEITTKKYTVKVSAPNMYEMFSAISDEFIGTYKFINSSKSESENPGMNNLGIVEYSWYSLTYDYGIRPVAYFDKNVVVNSGKGTADNPFKIKK